MKAISEYTAKDLAAIAGLMNILGRSAMKKADLYTEISERIERCYDLAKAEDESRSAADVEISEEVYPRWVANVLIWACCESSIGPVCAHNRIMVEADMTPRLQDVLDDNGWRRMPRKLKKIYKNLGF